MKTNVKLVCCFFLLLCFIVSFLIQSCGKEEYENSNYGSEYTLEQKQQISTLANRYGIKLQFVKHPKGKLETIEELEGLFKSLTSIRFVKKVPLSFNTLVSDDKSEILNLPKTRVHTESGSTSKSYTYTLQDGETLTFSINVNWSVLYPSELPDTPGEPTLNVSITLPSYTSKKGLTYSLETLGVTSTSIDNDKVTGRTAITIGVVLNGTKIRIENLTVYTDIDLKQGTADCTVGW